MRLRPVISRVAVVASAFAMFAGSLIFAQLAMADGQETRRAPTPPPPQQQQQSYVPTTPDIPTLAGGASPVELSSAGAGVIPCISTEDAYLAISQAPEGADIDAISAALSEVEGDPTGAASTSSSPLANRLRIALGLHSGAPPCETVLAALSDSVQLAQIAAAAIPGGPTTGAIGQPPPTSPSYQPLTPLTTTGARGHGYCSNISQGCPT